MKSLIKLNLLVVAASVVAVNVLSTQEAVANEMDYRVFFQHTSTYEDGAQTRWTGCVNTGGTCFSEESVVADCSFDGGSTWRDCNRPNLAGIQ